MGIQDTGGMADITNTVWGILVIGGILIIQEFSSRPMAGAIILGGRKGRKRISPWS